MRAPVDYPVEDISQSAKPMHDDITYATLIDRHRSDQPVTNDMIRIACLKMEAAQQFPFADKAPPEIFSAQGKVSHDAESLPDNTTSSTERVLNKLWNR